MRHKVLILLVCLVGLLALLYYFVSDASKPGAANLVGLSHRVSILGPLGIIIKNEIVPAYEKQETSATPEDLARGDPVQVTREVLLVGRANRGKAQQLFRFVYNNIAYEPYYGAKRGSFETSLASAGNDVDQAALVMAFFRAARIPCRFVRGVIEISSEQAMNWFRVTDPRALRRILNSQGLPHRWKGSRLQLEHFWVEALTGDTWRCFDPSFKQYRTIAGFDFEKIVQLETSGFTLDPDTDPELAAQKLESFVSTAALRLQSAIAAAKNTSPSDVFGGYEIIPLRESPKVPYQVVAVMGEYPQLPDQFKHKITIRLNDLEFTDTTSNLTRRRTTFHFVREGERLFPRLLVSNREVACGSAVEPGSQPRLEVVFSIPGQQPETVSRKVEIDAYYALGFDVGTIPDREIFFRADIARRIKKDGKNGQLNTDSVFGEILFGLAKAYFFHLDRLYQESSRTLQVLWFRQPSLVLCGYGTIDGELAVSVDLLRNVITPVSQDGDPEKEKDFMLMAGLQASSYESGVIEELGDGEALSTAKLFNLARSQGVPIYSIDADNWSSVSRKLQLPDALLNQIQAEVEQSDRMVLTTQRPLVSLFPSFQTGFVVLDPASYSADFRLGHLNGGVGVIDLLLNDMVSIVKGPSPKAKLKKIIHENDFVKALTDISYQTGSEIPLVAQLAKALDEYDDVFQKLSLFGALAGYYSISQNSVVNQLIPGKNPCLPRPKPKKPSPCPLPPSQQSLPCVEVLKRQAMKKIITDYIGKHLTMVQSAGPKLGGSKGYVVISVAYGLIFTTASNRIKSNISCLIDQLMANDPTALERLGKLTDITLIAGLNLRLMELYQRFMINPALYGTPGIVL